jgi:hypothetical protein
VLLIGLLMVGVGLVISVGDFAPPGDVPGVTGPESGNTGWITAITGLISAIAGLIGAITGLIGGMIAWRRAARPEGAKESTSLPSSEA